MKPKEVNKTNNPFSNKLLPSYKEKLKEMKEKVLKEKECYDKNKMNNDYVKNEN